MEKQKSSAFQLSGEAVEELNCVVCLENKTLLLLPCQHRCCTECTDNMRGEASHFTCPICRRDVQVPSEGLPVCMLTEYLKNQLNIVQEGGGRDKSVSGNEDQCEICNKNEVEMKCQQCKKFLCCRCSLKSKCESCEGSRHDIEDIEALVTAADSKLEAWVQATEKELSDMEEKLKQFRELQQKYQEKKTLLSGVRTVLVSDISLIDRLGIVDQIAAGVKQITGHQKKSSCTSLTSSDSVSDTHSFLLTDILETNSAIFDTKQNGNLWIITQVKTDDIVVATSSLEMVSFGTWNSGERPYSICSHKFPVSSSWDHTVYNNRTILRMNSQGVVKIWTEVMQNNQYKLSTSIVTTPQATTFAQVDPDHIYITHKTQNAIIKYSLDGNAVLMLQHPDIDSLTARLVGDAKHNRLFVLNTANQQLHMFVNDKHQWAIQVPGGSGSKLAVREQDSKVFHIGIVATGCSLKFKLTVIDPAKGAVLCERDITSLLESTEQRNFCDMAVVGNVIWFVSASCVTRMVMI